MRGGDSYSYAIRGKMVNKVNGQSGGVCVGGLLYVWGDYNNEI